MPPPNDIAMPDRKPPADTDRAPSPGAAAHGAPGHDDDSALAGLPPGLSSVRRAATLQQRAAAAGFYWRDSAPVLDKLAEELDEVCEAVAAGDDRDHIEEEIGDMLFVLVNLCRHTGADFEGALRGANAKFERRFRAMECHARRQQQSLATLSHEHKLALWRKVKDG